MKALTSTFAVLLSILAAVSTASAAEQSYPVKCRFFQLEGTLRPPLRDGHFLVQSVGDVTSLRLRSGEEELSITVRRGFERGQRGSEPTLQALEGSYDFQRYVLFFRDGVVIQHKDSLGKPLAVMSCQSNLIPVIADRLMGTEANVVGPMEASMIQMTNGIVSTQPAAAPEVVLPPSSAPAAPSVVAPSVPVPVAPPVIVPSPVSSGAPASNGLPPGMAENLEFIQQGN